MYNVTAVKEFSVKNKTYKLPIFLPDATRGFVWVCKVVRFSRPK